ncbi:MAG TPA: YsnF/AvaK domain-containing protein [Nitrososphaeraceae archaeon]|nr:YsnF/AvaK domain-containing protein [Nitrososphaeraceae archaeon]
MLEGSSYSGNIDWDDVIKKEARGINDEDLGEVQEVTQDYVLVKKGVINKEKLYIPRDLAIGYNGTILIFNITAEEAKNKFLRDSEPVLLQSQVSGEGATITDDLVIIPVMAERLDVSKKAYSQEAKIIKESITDTKTTEVQLVHEELYIETRPISQEEEEVSTAKGYQTNTSSSSSSLVSSSSSVQSDIPTEEEEEVATLFLRVEVPEVSKHPYLKEEIIVKKESITETKKISEQIRSEKVSVEGAKEEIKQRRR